jgi:2-succinyl-6-hydroxy-2,4-cyclohexadiene-1-carboxylate synthase
MLAHTIHGSNLKTKRVAFVHGFTQTRDSWAQIINKLPDNFHYITVDAPGHGESSQNAGDLEQTAAEIVDTVGSAVYCGYSMGARMCLHAALANPTVVEGLVLISGTAGIEDDAERRKRRQSDQQLAQHILDVGVDKFIDEWLTQPMFKCLPFDDQDRALRRVNTAAGLANNLLTTGTGSQLPLWDRLAELRMPVLIIAGINDTKFVTIAERLQQFIESSHLEIVTGAGHAVHYERPLIVAQLIENWLNVHFAN